MRGIRIVILLAAAAIVLSPLAAAVPGQAPQDVKAKAKVETGIAASAAPQQAAPEAKPAAPPAAAKKPAKKAPEKRTELIVPAFSGIKEQIAVYVFYVWLWLSIVILIYFLRLWVRESDRVYHAKYYEPDESPRKANPFPPTLGE
jgi:hypothetical protein